VLRETANALSGRLPQYTRNARHLQLLRRYGNRHKIVNLTRAELARLRGDVVLRSRPYVYTIDIGNVCNLRCPLCPTGSRALQRPQGFMKLRDFEVVLEKVASHAVEIVLHNWGEPFLHPQLLEIVRTAKAAEVGTAVSTNLNLVNRDREFLREIVGSGLDHLVISVDGTTQDVYEIYRRGGHLEQAFTNLKELLACRQASGTRSPQIEWQFLVMRHNEHQIEDARRKAAELGVDRIRFTGAGLPFDELTNASLAKQWLPRNPDYRDYDTGVIAERGWLHDEACFYLYRGMTVNPMGEVSPCCAIHHEKWDFGNLLDSALDEIWNNDFYRASRALFSRKPQHSSLETVCHQCPLFRHESRRSSGPRPRRTASSNGAGPRRDLVYRTTTRVVDVVVASAVLILTAPLMLVIGALIRRDSPGPAIFRHQRVGLNRRSDAAAGFNGAERRKVDRFGKPFQLYKFRTMYVDARDRFPELYAYRHTDEEMRTLPIKVLVGQKQTPDEIRGSISILNEDAADPRVTRVGRWFRRTSLDELPNFLNVLKGDLRLVGPRPDIQENIEYYTPRHLQKLEVKPGITGLAQVHGRGHLTFQQTNEYDIEYVESQSLWLDLKIVIKTVLALVRRDGAV
jgi:radical SAM protein with 4Fe4S-binding SPASM domain